MVTAGNCDNCVRPGGIQYQNLAEEAHLLLSAVKVCGGNFGLGVPIDVLRGSRVCFWLFILKHPVILLHVLRNPRTLVLLGFHISFLTFRIRCW